MNEITDADRKAAQDFLNHAGQGYTDKQVAQAFAAHRLQERDRVVAWLREVGRNLNISGQAHAWADAIASGAHDQEKNSA